MKPSAYMIPLLFPALALAGMALGGWWTLLLPVFAFGFVPMMEVMVRGRGEGVDGDGGHANWGHDLLLAFALVLVWCVWGVLLIASSTGALTGWSLLGSIFSAGLAFGWGINVAHELGHRRNWFQQFQAKAMLLPSLYMHFVIEHNRGHHRNVATLNDPATARFGEIVYSFWFRSVSGGWLSAWAIESKRLRNKVGLARWSQDEMLRMQVTQLACVVGVGLALGGVALVSWVGAALVGVLLLETINFIEHYGLLRDRLPNGRFERVQPRHSWTSDHPIGRILMFELPRHADHHANPGRHYAALRHFSQAPQLPTGYAGMVLVALCPPLFRGLVHPRLEAERVRLAA